MKELAAASVLSEQTIRFGIEKQKPKTDKGKHWQAQLKRFGSKNKNPRTKLQVTQRDEYKFSLPHKRFNARDSYLPFNARIL